MPFTSNYIVQVRRRSFCRLRSTSDLAILLGTPIQQLAMLALRPDYHVFTIPKKDGSFRQIEDPADPLKEVQDQLNDFLQAVYHHSRTDAAYGFLISVKGEAVPRNILTNAQQHQNCRWLFNADIEDFFHQVKTERVFELFLGPPFRFEAELADLLTKLCTHSGRLPMGAPTSPVLSNFAMMGLDLDYLTLANSNKWTYTRYADDLSFSANKPITESDRQQLRNLAANHGFPYNPKKEKLMGPDEAKEVTGLKIGKGKIELPDGFLLELTEQINKLAGIISVETYMQKTGSKWVEKYKQQVRGMLEFSGFVMGEHAPEVVKLEKSFKKAIIPPDPHELFSWLNFPYI
jgi:RNA-directed DNA polymerase